MLYDDLLKKAWHKIAELEQEKALRLAFDAGMRAAEDAISDSGSEIVRFRSDKDLRDYFFIYLIDTDDFQSQLEEDDRLYWKARSLELKPADPRVDAFGDSWLWYMEEELAKDFPDASPNKLHRRYFTGMRPLLRASNGNRKEKASEDGPEQNKLLCKFLDLSLPAPKRASVEQDVASEKKSKPSTNGK